MELNACMTAEWDVQGRGPARRVYVPTDRGEEHFQEWATMLDRISGSMKVPAREANVLAADTVRISE